MRILPLVLLSILAVSAVAEEPALPLESITLPPELARVLTDYERAWEKKDAAQLASLFAEEGYVLATGKPPVQGRTAIEQHYTGQGGPLSLRAFSFAADGKVAYILGGYTTTKGEPDIGKFTLTLRRSDEGRWLIVSDMDNANSRPKRPSAGPAPNS
ncbi:MAG TPA: nuclear transport factor 2 family protein [Thermoanaerobaculia bacterium]